MSIPKWEEVAIQMETEEECARVLEHARSLFDQMVLSENYTQHAAAVEAINAAVTFDTHAEKFKQEAVEEAIRQAS